MAQLDDQLTRNKNKSMGHKLSNHSSSGKTTNSGASQTPSAPQMYEQTAQNYYQEPYEASPRILGERNEIDGPDYDRVGWGSEQHQLPLKPVPNNKISSKKRKNSHLLQAQSLAHGQSQVRDALSLDKELTPGELPETNFEMDKPFVGSPRPEPKAKAAVQALRSSQDLLYRNLKNMRLVRDIKSP